MPKAMTGCGGRSRFRLPRRPVSTPATPTPRQGVTASCRVPKEVCMDGTAPEAASRVIVVEGLFDLASLWQAGFTNAVALLGSQFNRRQQAQLCDGGPRTVYLCLDADENGS